MSENTRPREPGNIAKIDLKDGTFAFAILLDEPLMAFYDMKAISVPSIETIIASPILFKVWVMNDAVTSGRWPIVGKVHLDTKLREAPKFFKQDPVTKALSIYYQGVETPATRAECEKLECAAVWSAEHIEDRLRDYFAGVPNQWVESFRPQ